MEGNELITCLKVLSYLRVESESLAVKRLLHLLKDKINDLSPTNLLFLSWMLSKSKRTPLVEAILIAIPIVFNINLGLKLDHENTKELADLLRHISAAQVKVSDKSKNSIATALALHGDSLEVSEAKSIIWSLSMMHSFDRSFEKVCINCISILNTRYMELTMEEIESTLERMMSAYMRGNYIFYNETFFNNCVKFVIKNDVGFLNASYILRKLNKFHFISFELLDYVDECIVDNHANLSSCKLAGVIALVQGLSTANYKPQNWEIIKSLIHENPVIHTDRTDYPWTKFALYLMTLGFHSNILLEKIFSSEYLEKNLVIGEKYLNYMQFLLLWQSVKLLIPDYDGPLPDQKFINEAITMNRTRINESFDKLLSEAFGGTDIIQRNVLSSHGHCLDFTISFDVNDSPIVMPCVIKKYEEIPKSQVKTVAVFLHPRTSYSINFPERLRGYVELRQRTIQALGIKIVNISSRTLYKMNEGERMKYVDREIRYALR